MAIEKNSCKVSRFDSEFSPYGRDGNTMASSEDEEFQRKNLSAVDTDDDEDDDFDDCDSGAGSDDVDLLEFGEAGEEFCQVGDQTCSIPVELYDLPGLRDILSVDVWNDVLTEEDRFSLTQFLPDMDQENFLRTLLELFSGSNLHFGNPIDKLFDMLKGGLCEPRVAMYRQGLNFFQRRQHYHLLRKYQNTMVSNLCQMKDAWLNCKGYSIEEKLQVLNIVRSEKSLMYEKMEELKSDSSEMEEPGDGMWRKKAKDRKLGPKLNRQSAYGMGSASDVHSLALKKTMESTKHGKQNKKGALKLGGSKAALTEEVAGGLPSVYSGTMPLSQHNRMSGYDPGASFRRGDQMLAPDDEGESMYEVPLHREQRTLRAGVSGRTGNLKVGKKHEALGNEAYFDNSMGVNMYGKNKAVNQLSDIKVLTSKPFNSRIPYVNDHSVQNFGNFMQHPAEDRMRYVKPKLALRGTEMGTVDVNDRFWLGEEQGGHFLAEQSSKYTDWNVKSKKRKSGRDSSELGISNGLYDMETQSKAMLQRVRETSLQNGGRAAAKYRGGRASPWNDETESDSSEQIDEDEDDNPLMRSKWAFPSGVSGGKLGRDSRKSKHGKKDAKDGMWTLDGSSQFSGPIPNFSEHQPMMKNGNPSWRAEQKGKMHDIGQIQASGSDLNERYFFESGRLTGGVDWQQIYQMGMSAHVLGDQTGRLQVPAFNALNLDKRKGEFYREYGVPQSGFQLDNDLDDDDSLLIKSLAGNAKVSARLGKKGQLVETHAGGQLERSSPQLIGCNSGGKKRKVKDEGVHVDEREDINYLLSDGQLQTEDADVSRKRGKRKAVDDTDALEKGGNEVSLVEKEVEEAEADTKPQKKPFILITPSFHTGFSFSIIHLLTAVRMAMTVPHAENSSEVGKPLDQSEVTANFKESEDIEQSICENHPNADVDVNASEAPSQPNGASLTVQEIVNRVKTNPGDPSILETQEPLQDLVRGVLKIFSSRTAPLGAKGWKPLVVYEKTNKSWSWIGPVIPTPPDLETPDELTSPDAWGLPHKMVVKLVDSFANWLKNGQETLQQIGSLPAPPSTLMEFNLDEKERFKDLRAQKSLATIGPSSEEVRSYFRKEEVLRYSIPDRAFAYTAFDGKKSIVAPLRRCGGKPTSKARDHFMLKRDRPPHVTILCLVRDAAARLPGSIGTRADVCSLIRDSQYIVEDVSDAQVNQVVSGALDRLHYERDPCVQFDGERKLWKYLHREREEEDFEDDGTSSTKKWKRQKKEANESGDQETVTVAALPENGEPSGLDLTSDLNTDPAVSMEEDNKPGDMLLHDAADDPENNVEISPGSVQGVDHDAPPMVWDPVGLNSMQENSLLCQENSTNDDFDDEIFCREPLA
ncbi:OLC1v1004136C1 [Oldenlandia corymbosa var. corymbosa]|uniref:OLC1v1004136C1 n=1 Tax=Oldenlandia corymbosa var. corymbosa TaxID=529605 RepID=A0AAV1DEZ8_OLDCO|nr:OLC1v1004136C1 [Oldenlandia corymbosa var. corymbosa]